MGNPSIPLPYISTGWKQINTDKDTSYDETTQKSLNNINFTDLTNKKESWTEVQDSFCVHSNDSDRIRSVSFLVCKRLYFSAVQIAQLHGVLLSLYFFVYFHPISDFILACTSSKRSRSCNKVGRSLFIQPNKSNNSLWISCTRCIFQHIDSLWNTRFLNARNLLSGADTVFRWRSFLGRQGNARRKPDSAW